MATRTKAKPVEAEVPGTAVNIFVVFHTEGDASVIKTQVDSVETGKKLLDEVHGATVKNKVYYNTQRGLLIRTSKLNKAYLAMEQVSMARPQGEVVER